MYLEIQNLRVLYDRAMILNQVSLTVDAGELVGLVGPNGAGKSTFLRALAGLIRWEKDTLKGTVLGRITLEGSIRFEGEEIINLAGHEIVKKGIVLCPERGRPFKEMTVLENLEAGAYLIKDQKLKKETLEKVFSLFPVLEARRNQMSGTLSGGERSMLAIGRGLMTQSNLLLIDEPSVGLAPKIKKELFSRVKAIHETGNTILLVEQDVSFAFELASKNYVMSKGRIVAKASAETLRSYDILRETYLGVRKT